MCNIEEFMQLLRIMVEHTNNKVQHNQPCEISPLILKLPQQQNVPLPSTLKATSFDREAFVPLDGEVSWSPCLVS